MKKFYISIFATVFLLGSFVSKAQVYNSITSNPLGYTLDDPNFWVGPQPGNPCDPCVLNIYSSVYMVQENGAAPGNGGKASTSIDGPFLNNVVIRNGSLNLFGNITLTINSHVEMENMNVILGQGATILQSIVVNDQIGIDGGSSVRLANQYTGINASNLINKTIIGPYDEIGNVGFKAAGIYSNVLVGGSYTQVLEFNGIGSVFGSYTAPGGEQYYTLNCTPTVSTASYPCDFGYVYGPAITGPTPPGPTDFGIIFGQTSVLPVVLVQFVATKGTDGSVKLGWATSQETNSGYFDIERSSDESGWSKIGSVKAKGNSSITVNYSYTDKVPLEGAGYYRLKMVDLDGKFKYSKTVTVSDNEISRPLVIYNNPFTDLIRMKVNVSRAQNLTMTVSDMQGKTYVKQAYKANLGDNLYSLPSNIGGSGMYILRIQGDSYNQTVKLVKQ